MDENQGFFVASAWIEKIPSCAKTKQTTQKLKGVSKQLILAKEKLKPPVAVPTVEGLSNP